MNEETPFLFSTYILFALHRHLPSKSDIDIDVRFIMLFQGIPLHGAKENARE